MKQDLHILGSTYDSTYIKFQPNLYTWDDCKNHVVEIGTSMVFITVGDGQASESVGLDLEAMKEMREYLDEKIKFLEEN